MGSLAAIPSVPQTPRPANGPDIRRHIRCGRLSPAHDPPSSSCRISSHILSASSGLLRHTADNTVHARNRREFRRTTDSYMKNGSWLSRNKEQKPPPRYLIAVDRSLF